LCTRNLFELNVRLKYIIKHDCSLDTWMREVVMAENQILDAISIVANVNHSAELELFKIKNKVNNVILEKHNFKSVKSPETKKIAEDVGGAEEYMALFKLFSKLLHPALCLIN
ncbi:DUF5677 domain-containing protein, partial [Pantoea latae]|uniref:DUF5677 domain-containing protein n=1 Tax=Pantoea latae TaxID=1964541 RepID=UPI001F427320